MRAVCAAPSAALADAAAVDAAASIALRLDSASLLRCITTCTISTATASAFCTTSAATTAAPFAIRNATAYARAASIRFCRFASCITATISATFRERRRVTFAERREKVTFAPSAEPSATDAA
jgi:hypothetical protein